MKRIVCALALFFAGCNSCYVAPPVPAPVSSHDVVPMDAIPVPAPTVAATVEPPPAPPPKIAARRILIIGDSEACAIAPQVAKAKLPTDTVDVECKGGTVVQYWGAQGHFKAALAKHPKPDVVLIFLGTN